MFSEDYEMQAEYSQLIAAPIDFLQLNSIKTPVSVYSANLKNSLNVNGIHRVLLVWYFKCSTLLFQSTQTINKKTVQIIPLAKQPLNANETQAKTPQHAGIY